MMNLNNKKAENAEAVTHTHTHGILNKKAIIVIIACIIIVMFTAIIIALNKQQIVKNLNIKAQKEVEDNEKINLKIEIKQETDEMYTCLLTFTAKDDENKIKEIEYPYEEGKEIRKLKVANEEGKQQIGIDYEVKKEDEDKVFKVTTQNGEVEEKRTGYTVEYKDGDDGTFKKIGILKTSKDKIQIINTSPEKEGKHFIGWSTNKEAVKPDYFENGEYKELDKDITFYSIWVEQKNGVTDNLNNESLLGEVSKINTSNKQQEITVNGETYTANVIVENHDLVLDGEKTINGATLTDKVYEFGDKDNDVAKLNTNEEETVDDAKNMVILKVNGNLTINYQVTLTTCKSDNGYGGPKGLLIYCTGTLTNNGTIDMTARGARAEGQDVYLWKNASNNYEFVPKEGALGGEAVTSTKSSLSGLKGEDGIDRKTRWRWIWM